MVDILKTNPAVGPSASLKSSINAQVAHQKGEQEEAKAVKAEASKVQAGDVIYKLRKQDVFNCKGPNRENISFRAGMYIARADDPGFDDIIETLDYFVGQRIMTKEEVK